MFSLALIFKIIYIVQTRGKIIFRMKYITCLPLLTIVMVIFGSCNKTEPNAQPNDAFREILTENTQAEWIGDSDHWRFEDGVLIGETTPENIIIEHSFFIWNKEITEDFELKLEYRISSRGNSGINYRSEVVEAKEFVMRGYQADIDGANEYTGQLYEDKGRAFLTRRGQVARIDSKDQVHKIGSLGSADDLLSQIKNDGWNSYKIIAKGNTLIHVINERVMSITIDHGSKMKESGLLGFQLHLGPPMKVEYRNILFRKL